MADKEAKRLADEEKRLADKEAKRLADEEKRLADEKAPQYTLSSPPPDDTLPMVTDTRSSEEDVESSSSTLIYLCVASVFVIACSIGYKRIRSRSSDQYEDNMFETQGSTESERESDYSDVSDIFGTILESRTSTDLQGENYYGEIERERE